MENTSQENIDEKIRKDLSSYLGLKDVPDSARNSVSGNNFKQLLETLNTLNSEYQNYCKEYNTKIGLND